MDRSTEHANHLTMCLRWTSNDSGNYAEGASPTRWMPVIGPVTRQTRALLAAHRPMLSCTHTRWTLLCYLPRNVFFYTINAERQPLSTSAHLTSRDSMTSNSWRQSRRIRKLEPASTIRADPLRTHYRRTCVKSQLIRLRTLGEEAFGKTALRQKLIFMTKQLSPLLCSLQRKIG